MNKLKYWEGNVIFLIYFSVDIRPYWYGRVMVHETKHQLFTNIDVISLTTNFITAESSWSLCILFILYINLEK